MSVAGVSPVELVDCVSTGYHHCSNDELPAGFKDTAGSCPCGPALCAPLPGDFHPVIMWLAGSTAERRCLSLTEVALRALSPGAHANAAYKWQAKRRACQFSKISWQTSWSH